MSELCGFYGLKGGKEMDNYEALSQVIGAAPKKGKGISRPAIVHEAASAHKIITSKLRDAVKKGATVSKFKKIAIHGETETHSVLVGASGDPVVTKKLTPKQKAALDKYNKLAAVSEKKTDQAKKSISNAAQKASILRKNIGKTSGAHLALKVKKIAMHGCAEVCGADPDPNNPGFLTDGTPDPAVFGEDASTDVILNDPSTKVQSTPVPISTAPTKVPADGIIYDGTAKGWPRYCVGSKKYFDMTKNEGEAKTEYRDAFGYVWGYDHMNLPNSPDPKRWIKRTGKRGFKADTDAGSVILNILSAGTYGLSTAAAQTENANWDDTAQGVDPINPPGIESVQADFGPLIGNPKSDFANLRWATQDRKWFWYPTEAPDWATVEIRNEAALAQAAIDDAAKAAKKAADDAAAKIKADHEAQAAEQEFQNTLAEKQATSEAAVAETQRQSKEADEALAQQKAEAEAARAQQQAEAEAAKAQRDRDAAQAQADIDYQKAQDAAAAKQAELDAEARQIQLEYLRAHPEALAQQPPQEQGATDEGSDAGGGEGDQGYVEQRPFGPQADDPFAGVPYDNGTGF